MIRAEDVADLREGDVVEYHRHDWPAGVYIRGPLHQGRGDWIGLGDIPIRFSDGQSNGWADREGSTLTVVSRAPRLYVNHPRTEPEPGDVVRDGKGDIRHVAAESADFPKLVWWGYGTKNYGSASRWTYCSTESIREMGPATLLVDGTTGQVVP